GGGSDSDPLIDRCLYPPVIEIAAARRVLLPGGATPARTPDVSFERYLDHGIGLSDGLVERAGEALPSLLLARSLAPGRPAPLLPRDRGVLALLSRVRGLCGDAGGALESAGRLLQIDPESEDGHYQSALALRELSRSDEAAAAEAHYLYHRRPVEVDQELRA